MADLGPAAGSAVAAIQRQVRWTEPLDGSAFAGEVESMTAALVDAFEGGRMHEADGLPKPWDKLPDEGWAEYRSFQHYLSLPKRTLRQVAIASGATEAVVSRLSQRNAWRRRAEVHDWWWRVAADAMRRQGLADAVQESVRQVAQMPGVIADALSVAKSRLSAAITEIEVAEESGEPHPVSLNQLARLLDSVKSLSAELRAWTQASPTISLNVGSVMNVTSTHLTTSEDVAQLIRGLAEANLIDAEVVE